MELGNVPIEDIAELALREGNFSNYLYRVHRWFARRVGSQFRAILTALTLSPDEVGLFWKSYLGNTSIKGAVVLDPFIGGGTSLVESIKCNARVIGFDIDPVAAFITKFELAASSMDVSYPEIDEIKTTLSRMIKPLHKTFVNKKEHDVLHHFWVQFTKCTKCHQEIELHPHYQLAYSKEKNMQWVFCRKCRSVHELPLSRKIIYCSCGIRTRVMNGSFVKGNILCPNCKHVQKVNQNRVNASPPQWRLFAQEYLIFEGKNCLRRFKRVEQDDILRFEIAEAHLKQELFHNKLFAPERLIPKEGRSDKRPLIHGIYRYKDFFNSRQLLHLHLLGKEIQKVKEENARKCLEIAFSEHLTTNCMYTGYAFGYRRTSPMFSIHSYRHITRPVELNPWLEGIGRGTFPNTLNKISRAISFAKNPSELHPEGGRFEYPNSVERSSVKTGSVKDVLTNKANAAVMNKSSEDLSVLPDYSVDLILTDPPYFDNLNYSELSDFYLAWHQILGISEPPFDNPTLSAPISQNLAISRRSKEDVAGYQERLKNIFRECYRVLKQNGICVFTYHHRSASAWESLGNALVHSGLRVTKVLPMRGEGQGGLHSHNGTIKWDAVFVCRKKKSVFAKGHKVVVSKKDINACLQIASEYLKNLSEKPKIGFRFPDSVNLIRALIISKASLGEINTGNRPVSDALKDIPNQGDFKWQN